MILVEIINVFLTSKGDEFIILLRGPEDKRTLPISIGQLEAQSIAMKLYHVDFPRPLTHDLFKSAFDRIGYTMTGAVIYDLLDSTFHANITFEHQGETIEIDSRPSDAIALAVRWNAPIFVAEKVLEDAGIILPDHPETERLKGKDTDGSEPSTLETLRTQLGKAIAEERYEDASRLRDEINRFRKAN
ncbi:MAG: bifunctional nuclease family protein [Chitinispirillaceae bacterium]|nr:bifunctional nuclease family protein [Chitinispirillaceae bacterium]